MDTQPFSHDFRAAWRVVNDAAVPQRDRDAAYARAWRLWEADYADVPTPQEAKAMSVPSTTGASGPAGISTRPREHSAPPAREASPSGSPDSPAEPEDLPPPATNGPDPSHICAWEGADLVLVPSGGKRPLGTGWQKIAPPSLAEVEAHVRRGGSYGIISRGPVACIDVDPKAGGLFGWAALCRDVGDDFADDLRVLTGGVYPEGQGFHVYLAGPTEGDFRKELKQYAGVEVRIRANFQTLGPGSVHPVSGRMYVWTPAAAARLAQGGGKVMALLRPVPKRLLDIFRRGSDGHNNTATALPAPTLQGFVEHMLATGWGQTSDEALREKLARLPVERCATNAEWQPVLMAAAHAAGGRQSALAIFQRWCAGDVRFAGPEEQAEIGARWRSVGPGSPGTRVITVRTLDREVRTAQGELIAFEMNAKTKQPLSTRTNAERAFLHMRASHGLRLRLNELSGQIEVWGSTGQIEGMPNDESRGFHEWTDADMHALRSFFARSFGLEVSADFVQSGAVTLAGRDTYNPLIEWLTSVRWDGSPRIDAWLTKLASADDSPYVRGVARITMLGAVARAFQPGVKFDTVTILEGLQGTLKSSLVRALGGEWYREGLPPKDISDRDVVDAMRGGWIIELGELDAVRKSAVSALKAFLSRQEDRARLAYARNTQSFPRRSIFIVSAQ